MRARAIIYPVAGGGRPKKVWPPARDRLIAAGWDVSEVSAEHRTHGVELAAAAAGGGWDAVIAVGGDGTIHWIANGLMQAPGPRPVLAVLPAGTGSDFAAAVGIPSDPAGAVEVMLAGARRRVDLGRIEAGSAARYFVTIGTVGFGGEVAQLVSDWSERLPPAVKNRMPGPLVYLAGILKMLVTYSPVDMELTMNGAVRRQRLFMVGVGNTLRAAGGMRLCPGARPDDEQFEIILIGNVTKPEVLRLLPQTFSGRHVTHRKVEVAVAARLTVASDTPLTVQADGEIVGHVPATFAVVPAALEVLAPPATP